MIIFLTTKKKMKGLNELIWPHMSLKEVEKLTVEELATLLDRRGLKKTAARSALWCPCLADVNDDILAEWVDSVFEEQNVKVCQKDIGGRLAFYVCYDNVESPDKIRLFYAEPERFTKEKKEKTTLVCARVFRATFK